MGRNNNRDKRGPARRGNAVVQAGGRPQGGGGGGKKDTGLPSFFKQRHAVEADKRRRDKTEQLADDGMQLEDGAMSGLDRMSKLQQRVRTDEDERIAGPSRLPRGADLNTFEYERAARDLALTGKRDNSAKAFMRDVKGVIDNSDVILQVLDARDPLASRSRQTELVAMGSGKKVVLVMNKIDLIPTSSLQAWLRYLRNDFPTLAFKSSTQKQRSNLKQGQGEVPSAKSSRANGASEHLSHGSESIGATALLQLLKNYARTTAKGSNLKTQLTVGVVGPPNVGKSSLINSLLRTRACAVASTPGWTKVVQGVSLEKGIRLLDCPGVVLGGSLVVGETVSGGKASEAEADQAAWSVLRNTVKVELIDDPIAPVQAMLKRVDAKQLEDLYSIEGGFNEGDAYDFLLRLSLVRGKLKQGGVPDLEGAARIVLHDWNIGKIAFHTMPPAVHPSMKGKADQASAAQSTSNTEAANEVAGTVDGTKVTADMTSGTSLVTGFSEAFDLDALFGEADAEALGTETGASESVMSKTAGAANGKFLVQARERRYADQEPTASAATDAIEEDEETPIAGLAAPADVTSSSLGKRQRGMDDMAPSDDESEDEDEAQSEADADDYSDANADSLTEQGAGPFEEVATGLHTAARGKTTVPQLSMRERELLGAFSSEEVAGLAKRRSDVRKANKKSKKRLRKSGAGLVDALESGLAFVPGQNEAREVHKPTKPASQKTQQAQRRGLFDVFSPEQEKTRGAVDEDEEEL